MVSLASFFGNFKDKGSVVIGDVQSLVSSRFVNNLLLSWALQSSDRKMHRAVLPATARLLLQSARITNYMQLCMRSNATAIVRPPVSHAQCTGIVKTRSSATAERQRVSCTVFLGSLTDRALH